jgi:hypothetical protein
MGDVDLIHLAQDAIIFRLFFLQTIMVFLGLWNAEFFFTSLATVRFPRRAMLHVCK